MKKQTYCSEADNKLKSAGRGTAGRLRDKAGSDVRGRRQGKKAEVKEEGDWG